MQIKVKHVDVETVKGVGKKADYQKAEVIYDNGQYTNQTFKLMSFSNPDVFKTVSKASKGDQFDVEVTKNAAGFNQWVAIKPLDGDENVEQPSTGSVVRAASSSSTAVSRPSTYETAEERAVRQRLIVRQSSITSAIATLSVGSKGLDADAVMKLAEEYVEFVFEKVSLFDEPNDLDTDLPF